MKKRRFQLNILSPEEPATLESAYLKVMQAHLKHDVALKCSSIAWDKKLNQLTSVRAVKSKSYFRIYRLLSIVTTIRSISMMYKSGSVLSEYGGSGSYQLVFMLVFTFILCMNWLAAFDFGRESISSEGCMMVNHILKYGKKHAEPFGKRKCLGLIRIQIHRILVSKCFYFRRISPELLGSFEIPPMLLDYYFDFL